MDTLFLTLSLTPTLLLDEIHVGTIFWKLVPHKMVRHTWVSSNRRVSVKESVRNRMLLTFLIFRNEVKEVDVLVEDINVLS